MPRSLPHLLAVLLLLSLPAQAGWLSADGSSADAPPATSPTPQDAHAEASEAADAPPALPQAPEVPPLPEVPALPEPDPLPEVPPPPPAAAAPEGFAVLPLVLTLEEAPGELVVGVPVTLPLDVSSTGLAGQGVQPPLDREVHLTATLDSDDPVALHPDPVVLAASEASAPAWLSFTPTVLGPLDLEVEAAWETWPGEATLQATFEVVKDDLDVEDLEAGAPDSDYRLPVSATFRSGHLTAEPLTWRIEAEHTPTNATEAVTWTAAEGHGAADPTGEDWEGEVQAKYGPGRYTLRLHAGGDRLEDASAEVEVEVPQVRNQTEGVDFVLDVDDHPTTLALTSDSVNDDGKAKAPGSALITRVEVADANGLGDVAAVEFRYARLDDGEAVVVDTHRVTALDAQALEAEVEDRFITSPMKDASYEVHVVALGSAPGAPVLAEARRTFVITDVKPQAEVALGSSFFPERTGELTGELAVLDANFGTGPLDTSDIHALGEVELRLYKGSRLVDEPGWEVLAAGRKAASSLTLDLSAEGTRSTQHTYAVRDGKGALSFAVAVTIPEGATAGTYRLSVVGDGNTMATASFEVRALPRVSAFTSASAQAVPGEAVALMVEVMPIEGVVGVQVRTAWDTTVQVPRDRLVQEDGRLTWQGEVTLPVPWDDEAPVTLTALADLGAGRVIHTPSGEAVNTRDLALEAANLPPRLEAALSVSGAEVGEEAWLHPLVSEELRAAGRAWDDNALLADLSDEVVSLDAEVRDWQGRGAAFEVEGDLRPGGFDLQVRPLLAEPGKYTLRLTAEDDDGISAERALTVNVGTHFRMELLAPEGGVRFAPQADGSLAAAVQARLKGNAAAGSLTVLAEGLPRGLVAEARLTLPNGTVLEAPLVEGTARFAGERLLGPCETATVEVRVPSLAGVPAGRFDGRILVAGEAV